MFTRNIGVKLLSFVLAFFIWIIIMSISDPQITKKIDGIPIETRHKDDFNNLEENEDLSINILTTGTVSIKVSGKRSEIEDLSAGDFVAYADFNDFVGINAIPIHVEPRKQNLVNSLEITYQSKTVMQVQLVKSETKLINVVVEMINVPDDKYAYCKSVSSKLLEVTGPQEVVESVGKLVAYVDVAHMSGSMDYVTLEPVNLSGVKMDASSLEVSQSTVRVEVALYPVKEVDVIIDTSETEVVSGFAIYDAEQYSPKKIRIAAEEETLQKISMIRIPFKTDEPLIKEIKPVTKDFDITKYLPEGVYLKSENTVVSSSIVIEALGEKEYTVKLSELELRGLPEGYRLETPLEGDDEPEITIVVTGFKPETDKITGVEDLHAYIDLEKVMKTGLQTFSVKLDTGLDVKTEAKVELLIGNAEE
jgi:YbbR domain-containing protein